MIVWFNSLPGWLLLYLMGYHFISYSELVNAYLIDGRYGLLCVSLLGWGREPLVRWVFEFRDEFSLFMTASLFVNYEYNRINYNG